MNSTGNRNSATIWGGVVGLAESGSWFIAAVVFLASILIPFCKLMALFYLAATAHRPQLRQLRKRIYAVVDALGRWSMLDIFLLAVLVAIMKLNHWTSVKPELGAVMFLFVVIFTMLASAVFEPDGWPEQLEMEEQL